MFALDLNGRCVVAVGGGAVGTRRVLDLLSAGARVRVIAPELSQTLRAAAEDGLITWIARGYVGPSDLDGAWLVHTATGVPPVDARVAADADTARIWCVNATVSVGGSARTPARRRLQTPDGVVDVGVSASGDPGRARAVANAIRELWRVGGLDVRRHRARTGPGWVALVGGGPGRADLLTVRGAQLLAAADVIVVDRLAPREAIAGAADGVRVIDVGTKVGAHAVPQAEINQILVDHARLGLGVVRLKGGDPYVLGRGVEERYACENAGIPVEVVSGVSSAIAVPAAAGIPVTHRGVARGFTVLTGHDPVHHVPSASSHTVVLLMGVARLGATLTALMQDGRSPQCPAAIIERGLLPDQRTTIGTVADLAERAAAVGAGSPTVIVLGDVVRLSPAWGSFDARRHAARAVAASRQVHA